MKTTLNVHVKILEKINNAASLNGITNSEMITQIMKMIMDEIGEPDSIGKLVQYQKRTSYGNWHTFHIDLQPDDYEYFLDLRKLFKMSVSLILAFAVDKYLNKQNRLKINDNNLFKNYIIVKEMIDNVVSWRFIWGYPDYFRKLINNTYY